jgi:ribosome-binding factor A
MNERRIARLQEQIKQRVAEVVAHEMADPRVGIVTITRVKLDREMATCKVFWSVIGDEKARRRNEAVLVHARRYVQHEVAEILHTRSVPQVQFLFDESIEGVQRVTGILHRLKQEREAREGEAGSEGTGDAGASDGADGAVGADEDEDAPNDAAEPDEDAGPVDDTEPTDEPRPGR